MTPTLQSIMAQIRAHNEKNPNHGHNCSCHDEFSRHLKCAVSELAGSKRDIQSFALLCHYFLQSSSSLQPVASTQELYSEEELRIAQGSDTHPSRVRAELTGTVVRLTEEPKPAPQEPQHPNVCKECGHPIRRNATTNEWEHYHPNGDVRHFCHAAQPQTIA